MSMIRQTIGQAIFSGSVAAGLETPPVYTGYGIVGTEQMHEEPGGVQAPAPPAEIEIKLNRQDRRALGIPKGQFAKFVAENSIELTELEESMESVRRARAHRYRSTGATNF